MHQLQSEIDVAYIGCEHIYIYSMTNIYHEIDICTVHISHNIWYINTSFMYEHILYSMHKR